MNVKSPHRESASPEVAVERRQFPRVAVVRRIDSKPPTRVWSLLLAPSFLNIEPEVARPRDVTRIVTRFAQLADPPRGPPLAGDVGVDRRGADVGVAGIQNIARGARITPRCETDRRTE